MMMDTVEKDLCITCGNTIGKREAVIADEILPFITQKLKIQNCDKCLWRAFVHEQLCVARPFKRPIPREDLAGNPPKDFVDYVAKKTS
jgi:hypothetical protein